jgi:callose synthase
MSVTRRHPSQARVPPESSGNDVYNILPVHNMLADHPALRFPEVRAAADALKTIGGLRIPPYAQQDPGMDLLDWLGVFFGFQKDNVRNQREHLILLLANSQMRLQPPPDDIARLEGKVVRKLRKKILKNYDSWCAYLARKSNVWISDRRRDSIDERRELLYISLYLLIWGEAANLRFLPECLSYIFHHMAMELNRILEDYLDETTGQPSLPAYMGENAFLNRVVTPLYMTVKAEAEASLGGKAYHSA